MTNTTLFNTEIKTYWEKELSLPLPAINLPLDFLKGSEKANSEMCTIPLVELSINNELVSKSDIQGIISAAYFAWIARLSNETDILTGINIEENMYLSVCLLKT